jgi:endonuclease YncB( thermonuclease family)
MYSALSASGVLLHLDDRDLSLEMVQEGMAWHFRRCSKEATLADAERDARNAGRGLWADKNPVPPWVWRKQQLKSKK